MAPWMSNIDARRVLTYDDEDDDNDDNDYQEACPCPADRSSNDRTRNNHDSLRYIDEILNLTGTQGVAIVQRRSPNEGSFLDYAAAVRRKNPNSDSGVSRRLRATLPPREPTSRGSSPYQTPPNPQVRGCCMSSRRS